MKSEVYSWRVTSELKSSLEHAARSRGLSLAKVLEEAARSWLNRQEPAADDEAVQRRLHAQARATFGTLTGGDPELASEAASRVRDKLRKRHAARRAG
jgi:hypothetical protein